MKTERDTTLRSLAAAFLLTLLATAHTGCEFSSALSSEQGGDTDTDSDTDTDTDSDSDSDSDPPETFDDTDDTDCDTENQALFDLVHTDSNSMAGPVLARFLIDREQKVTGTIRVHEFLNYYGFDYEPPAAGPVAVGAQLSASDIEGGFDLQIGVRASDQAPDERRALNVTLAIDTSESMAGTPIQRVKQSCVALANSLRTGDIVSMVSWDALENAMLQSHAVQGPGDPILIGQCNALTASGTDDLTAGLIKAYSLASLDFDPGRLNRVVLISDGGVAASADDEELIAEHADDAAGEAIYLIGVGVGDDDSPGQYSDALMRAVTAAGKGAHIFIDSAEEATAMFGERFVSNVEIAARDVRVELTLPPTFEITDQVHGAEEPSALDPQHLAPGDAMIFQLETRSCDSSVPVDDDQVLVVATYEDPITRETDSVELDTTLGELLEDDAALLLKGNAVIGYARALMQLQSLEGQAALDVIDAARAQILAAAESLIDDPDLTEIDQLLATYGQLF